MPKRALPAEAKNLFGIFLHWIKESRREKAHDATA